MRFRADKNQEPDDKTEPYEDVPDAPTTESEPAEPMADEELVAAEEPEERQKSKRGVILILAGLVVTGVAATYKWWKKLVK